MEVVPREDDSHTHCNNAYHLALECYAYRTPANIERDAEFTNSCEGK